MLNQHSINIADKEFLPSPSQLKEQFQITPQASIFLNKSRDTIKQILRGLDSRMLLIVGPCSIHDTIAAKEYATKLKKLSEIVSDSFFIVMRAYYEKPRTTVGWKGLMHDPLLDGSNDIHTGLLWTRKLLIDLAEMGLPAGCEFLDPLSASYFGDLISWGCIGARTSSSQIHRQIASGLPMPIAFKNSPDGNIDAAVSGALSATYSHSYIGINDEGKVMVNHTQGNQDSHIMLRGGKCKSNYDPDSIVMASTSLKNVNLNECILVDCSHDNSRRQPLQQIHVFESVINQVLNGNKNIRGLMVESNLFQGSQTFNPESILKYAVSLTDPCIDWHSTEKLIVSSHERVMNSNTLSKNNDLNLLLSAT